MGKIPVSSEGSETQITWRDGRKIVTTDGGSRVDIYQNGKGKADGPGKDHLFATFDKNGNQTTSGGRVR